MEQLEATQRDRMEETAEGVAGIDKKALLLAVVGPQLLTVWCGRGSRAKKGEPSMPGESNSSKKTSGRRPLPALVMPIAE